MIGFVGGFLIMIFPKPVSAKTRARLSLARIISDLGDLYGSEISGFELEIGAHVKGQDIKARQERYRGQFLKIFVSLPFCIADDSSLCRQGTNPPYLRWASPNSSLGCAVHGPLNNTINW
jgi:hypothetical protein